MALSVDYIVQVHLSFLLAPKIRNYKKVVSAKNAPGVTFLEEEERQGTV